LKNTIASEYGLNSAEAAPSKMPQQQHCDENESRPQLPDAVMHQTVQNICDQRARVFAWISRYQFSSRAKDRNVRRRILMLAMKNARPLRHRAASIPKPAQPTYQIKPSLDVVRVLDFIYGVYTPDKNGNFQYESFFDAIGRFRFETKKIASQLDVSLRTLQRIVAQLTAMRLIDCTQISNAALLAQAEQSAGENNTAAIVEQLASLRKCLEVLVATNQSGEVQPQPTTAQEKTAASSHVPRSKTKRDLENWYQRATPQKRAGFLNLIFNLEVKIEKKDELKQRVDHWLKNFVGEATPKPMRASKTSHD
jgi:hypothetical protein